MSYLGLPRISFAGLFEADVNTVNNDVRNYDVDVFEARLQTLQKKTPKGVEYNGWWNPDGSNRFSLMGCAVTGAVGPDGAPLAADLLANLTIEAQIDRTAGKIVDLDPQYQFVSALWGMRIALVADGVTVLSGSLTPCSFRDLFINRVLDKSTGQPVSGSPGASARFTGALEDIVWTAEAARIELLRELHACAERNGKALLSGRGREALARHRYRSR